MILYTTNVDISLQTAFHKFMNVEQALYFCQTIFALRIRRGCLDTFAIHNTLTNFFNENYFSV